MHDATLQFARPRRQACADNMRRRAATRRTRTKQTSCACCIWVDTPVRSLLTPDLRASDNNSSTRHLRFSRPKNPAQYAALHALSPCLRRPPASCFHGCFALVQGQTLYPSGVGGARASFAYSAFGWLTCWPKCPSLCLRIAFGVGLFPELSPYRFAASIAASHCAAC